MKRKKILIDVNPVVPYFAMGKLNGISRTNLELIKALDKIPASDIPFDINLWSQNLRGIGGRNIKTRFKSTHLWFRHTAPWNKVARSLHLQELMTGYDMLHITHNYEPVPHPERTILTIHDVMYFSHPEPQFNVQYYCKVLPPLARKARHIITISECSKREIMEYMDVPEDHITVIPWGIDFNLLHPHKPEANKYCGSEPYFISVSCGIGRKNTISAVRAFVKFSEHSPRHHLILVWRNPSAEALKEIADNGLENKIHFASNISNEELADLYAGATASFSPSLYEGFGLPIAESMACGVPVITCDNSSLREVGGDAAIYVEPFDIDGMALLMEKFENKALNRQVFIEKGLQQVKQFTWEKCAEATLGVYRESLSYI